MIVDLVVLSDSLVMPTSIRAFLTMHIEHAIVRSQVVELVYQDVDGAVTRRCVEPCGIREGSAGERLLAWCRERDDVRAFRIDRVRGLRLMAEHFNPFRPRYEDRQAPAQVVAAL